MKKTNKLFIFLPMLTILSACAGSQSKSIDKHEQYDRFESYNRAMFKFNYKTDKYVIKPLALGYRTITNQFVRDRVSNVLATIKEPVSAVNHLLQAEPQQSGINLGRFAVNATLGMAGMFDVAEGWGMKRSPAGFDSTLAKWCVPDGPYLILPFVGPSTPRAATGLAFDSFTNPVYLATLNAPADVKDKIYYSYVAVNGIALRESMLDLTDDLERNSIDYYAAMRSAYLQNRQGKSCQDPTSDTAPSYDFDFGEDVEDETFNQMEQ